MHEALEKAHAALARRDYVEADRLLESACADDASGEAAFLLSCLREQGLGGAPAAESARDLLARAAARGWAEAQYRLALALDEEEDEFGALAWLEHAAKQAHAPAQHALAELTLRRGGGKKAEATALKWLRAAAKAGYAPAPCDYAHAILAGAEKGAEEGARALLEKAAEQGLTQAQYDLADMLARGVGGPADGGAAVVWFRLAAEQGHMVAQLACGEMLRDGVDCAPDIGEALRWLSAAAEQGCGLALFALADAHLLGAGVVQDDARAAELYALGAQDEGSEAARQRIARLFGLDAGAALPADPAAAIAACRAGAPPSVESRRRKASAPAEPQGVAGDASDAQKLRQRAEMGSVPSQYEYGLCLRHGDGVVKDCAAAAAWFKAAADAGHVGAALELATLFELGEGVPQDMVAAAFALAQPAQAGAAAAQWRLAQIYLRRPDIAPDGDMALDLLVAAGEQGHATAAYQAAMILFDPSRDDAARGLKLLTLAADAGHVGAQRRLGLSLGEEGDLQSAYAWLTRAAQNSPPGKFRTEALAERARFSAAMSPAEIAEAESIVLEDLPA